MVSFTLSTLTLGLTALTALTTALPSHTKRNLSPYEFTISAKTEGLSVLSLTAIESGVLGNLDLVFERPSAFPGTPAYLNATMLEFDTSNFTTISGSKTFPCGTRIQDVGDNHGYKTGVVLTFGNDGATTGFLISDDGTVEPPRTAALQSFYACNATLNGVEQLQLNFGVPKFDGSAPDGCLLTTLVQGFKY